MRRVISRLMAPVPAGRLQTVRFMTVLYAIVWVAIRMWHWRDLSRLPASRWEPVGIANWLGGPPSTFTVTAVSVVTLAAGVAALATTIRWAVSGPLLAIGFLWLTTFGASWGQILHTEQLVALHLLVLAALPSNSSGWALRAITAVTVATYFVSGIAKLRFGGGFDWLDGDGLMRLVAHDNVRKQLLGDASSPFAKYLVGHPGAFRAAAAVTLVVELGAPLALLGRRVAYAWMAVAWVFHAGVLALMAVLFPYPLVGVAFASMLPVERAVNVLRRRGRAAAVQPLRA